MEKKFLYSIGVDSGATNIRLALIRSDGKIIREFKEKSVISGISRGINERIKTIKYLYEQLSATDFFRQTPIHGVGIGISGQISQQGELIGHNGPRYPDISPINLKEKFLKVFKGHRIFIDNDSKAAALGEAFFGAGKDVSTLVHFTLGTGVGGGIIVNKRLIHGNRGLAGHLGFISVNKDGPRFISGMIGCVEHYASGTGIMNMGQNYAKSHPNWELIDRVNGVIENINSPLIFDVAEEGEPIAMEIINTAATYLGMAIVTCLHVINPEIVTLGGGLAERGEMYINRVRETIEKLAMEKYQKTPILIASTKDNSGILGAAALTGFTDR